MSANIMEEKIYLYRSPAWHNLGTVSKEPHSAKEAGDIIGLPLVAPMSLYVHGKAGSLQVKGQKVIVGSIPGKHAGGQEIGGYTVYTYGIVTDDYRVISHNEMCDIWDNATGRAPVETMGVLGHGERMFVTVELPSINVRGDEVANYLMVVNPLDGKTSVQARTTSVRVVCQNTLNFALGQASGQQFRGLHRSKTVVRDLTAWLRGVWLAQAENISVLKEAYALLADKKISAGHTTAVLTNVYPYPVTPEASNFKAYTDYEQAMDKWNEVCLKEAEHRTGVKLLLEGSAFHTEATRGTLWGLYNSVVEYEDYERPRATNISKIFGAGAERKQRAFDVCLDLART